MGRFDDRLTDPLPRMRDILRILRQGGFAGKRPKDEGLLVPRAPAAAVPDAGLGELACTWVGHATYLVQLSGVRIVTDPVWRDGLPGRIRRLTPPGIPLEAARAQVAVVSHNHYDHQDAWTFKRLPKGTTVLCPLGSKAWFTKRGFTDVRELDWWQSTDAHGVRFTFVPAHHWSRRTPWDTNDTLWGGWVMEKDGLRAYHAGDTAYGRVFQEIRARAGSPDVAMLPVGAYEPRWFMRTVHMDPDEAVKAMDDLDARVLAPMHWGTFPLTREPVLEPLERTRKAWGAAGRAASDLWDLPVGATQVFRARGAPVRDRRAPHAPRSPSRPPGTGAAAARPAASAGRRRAQA